MGYAPTYPGSDEYESEFAGLLRATIKDNWNNRWAIYPLGVSGVYDLNDDLALQTQIEYEAGDDGESADIDGLDKVESTDDGAFGLWRRWGNA